MRCRGNPLGCGIKETLKLKSTNTLRALRCYGRRGNALVYDLRDGAIDKLHLTTDLLAMLIPQVRPCTEVLLLF